LPANKTEELPDIVIRSEEEAYNVLQQVLHNEIGSYRAIRFEGWPSFSLYLKGKKFEQSLTPTVMRGLLELQKGIYKSYASAGFSAPNRRLSEEEKDTLEIKVSVKGGSSSLEINFQDIASKLIEQLGARMNPTEVLYSVLTIAVLYFGTSAYKSYLEHRKDTRAKEISDETQRRTLETLKFSTEQETKRTAIIVELAKRDSRIENIERLAYDTHTEIVKSLAAGTEAKLDGIALSGAVTDILTHNARRKPNNVRLDGQYRLLKLDWSDSNRFRVRVFNVDTGLQLDAEVQDESLTGKYKDALKAAEWSRTPIHLQINAKLLGENEYREAIIISAEGMNVGEKR
jgi:hypothetical protein